MAPHIYVMGQEFKNLEDKDRQDTEGIRRLERDRGGDAFYPGRFFLSTKLFNEHFRKDKMTQKPIKDKIFFLDDLVRRVERSKNGPARSWCRVTGFFRYPSSRGCYSTLTARRSRETSLLLPYIRDRDVKGPGRPIFPGKSPLKTRPPLDCGLCKRGGR